MALLEQLLFQNSDRNVSYSGESSAAPTTCSIGAVRPDAHASAKAAGPALSRAAARARS